MGSDDVASSRNFTPGNWRPSFSEKFDILFSICVFRFSSSFQEMPKGCPFSWQEREIVGCNISEVMDVLTRLPLDRALASSFPRFSKAHGNMKEHLWMKLAKKTWPGKTRLFLEYFSFFFASCFTEVTLILATNKIGVICWLKKHCLISSQPQHCRVNHKDRKIHFYFLIWNFVTNENSFQTSIYFLFLNVLARPRNWAERAIVTIP